MQSLGAVTSRTLQPGEQWIGTCARCFLLESGALTEMGRWNSRQRASRRLDGSVQGRAHRRAVSDRGALGRLAWGEQRKVAEVGRVQLAMHTESQEREREQMADIQSQMAEEPKGVLNRLGAWIGRR